MLFQFTKAQETNLENKDNQEDIAFAIIESVPIYPGCENAINKRDCFQYKIQVHIKNNFKYPRKALKEGIQGRVIVNFIIEKDGSITVNNVNGPYEILEIEARRIIEKMPKIYRIW